MKVCSLKSGQVASVSVRVLNVQGKRLFCGLCYNTGHFPLGYLAMGKNVFSQINDMFIQKEVTTLFRSSAASKFERKNESERERETESVCDTEIIFSFVLDKSQNHEGWTDKLLQHVLQERNLRRLLKN